MTREYSMEFGDEQLADFSDGGGSAGLPAGLDVGATEVDHLVDLEHGDPPVIRWDTDEDGFVDDFSSEEFDDGAYRLVQKLADAAQGAAAIARRRGRLETLSAITEEDFEPGPERDSFRIIQANKIALFGAKQSAMVSALEFFFSREDGEAVSFDLCCEVLGSRADVVRLRIQYEWFLRNVVFGTPFHFRATPLPRVLEGAVQIHGGTIGYCAAREAWVQPGILHGELVDLVCSFENCTRDEVEASLARLEEEMLFAHEHGWYVTGRNPLRMRRTFDAAKGWNRTMGGSMHWSALFGRES